MDDYLDGYFNLNYATDVPVAGLKRWGITDPSQVGVRKTLVADPTDPSGEGRMAGYQFYNKVTGEPVGLDGSGYLGEGPSLGVDKSGKIIGLNPTPNDSFFGGLASGFKEIAKSPAGQMLLAAVTGGTNLAGTIGSTLAPAASAATQAAIGGATIGAGKAALTGGNILRDAVIGGGLGYGGSTLRAALDSGITDADLLSKAADADVAGGLLPEYGTNAAYDSAMQNLMANSPGAVEQLQNVVNSQLGGTTGPDNIDVGGGWNPASSTVPSTENLPQADYSNEGRNYPTTESTQGPGGSPVNASTATTAGLPLVDTTGGLSNLPVNTLAKLALLGAGGAGIAALANDQGNYTMNPTEAYGPLSGYKFDPSQFRAMTPDPSWFRPGSEVTTVADAARRGYAQGGSTKPTFTPKAKLAAMDPWSRAQAEMNNAAYMGRMPRAMSMPQAGIAQLGQFAQGGGVYDLGGYSDGGRLLRGPGDGVSDSIPATIGDRQPARLADGEFVVPARIVSELGNGSTDAGARKLYAMMDRVQKARGATTGKGKVAKDTNADKHLPA